MDITITPGALSGTVKAIPSKSQAHRLLICAAFADAPTQLHCPDTNRDIQATADCLTALGATITRRDDGYCIIPGNNPPKKATLNCAESGSTLRFLLPVACALGVETTFILAGRLPQRPLSPLWEELERMGITLTRPTADTIRCQGKLRPGDYFMDGGVSSQFITGLLFAAALMDGDSRIHIQGKLESAPYVAMTQQAMELFGVDTVDFTVKGGQIFHSPENLTVEGDWSNAAFFLTAKALGNELEISNLDPGSSQGDRVVSELLTGLYVKNTSISAANIPDLIPILSIFAANRHGAVFTDIQRLRLKESDRVAAIIAMIQALGGRAEATEDTLTVFPTSLRGGIVDSVNDHRIAMSAAIASTVCTESVHILGGEAVNKSYPSFWGEFSRLGGKYEQYLR